MKNQKDKEKSIKPEEKCPITKSTLIWCFCFTALMAISSVLCYFGIIGTVMPGSNYSIINYWALLGVMTVIDIVMIIMRTKFLNREKKKENGKLGNNRNKKDRKA